MNRTPITLERLHELFEMRDGRHYWRMDKRPFGKKGALAGSRMKIGYWKLSVDGVAVLAHRVVYAMTHNVWPVGCIDHIDGDIENNHPSNLREVSRAGNAANRKTAANNSSGFPGVVRNSSNGKWIAQASINGKKHYFGHFCEKDSAIDAARAGRISLYGSIAPDLSRKNDPGYITPLTPEQLAEGDMTQERT